MKKIILRMDTTSRDKTVVMLQIDKKEFIKEQANISRNSQNLLPMIVEILKEHALNFSDITSIEVEKGPGSFTGVRVGVSIANALFYALDLPGDLVEPVYGM